MDMWDGRSRDGVGPMNTVFRGCGGIGSVGMGFGEYVIWPLRVVL